MTAKNGLPCGMCGTSDWYKDGHCKVCRREAGREYRRANPDSTIETARNWQRANRDKANEAQRRYQQANPGKVAAIKHRRRTRKTQAGGSFTVEEFNALCRHYGNKCLRCHRTDVKLEFDHVIPVSRGGTSDISNGQPLCRKCNTIKSNKVIDYRPDAGPLRWLQAKLFG